VATGRGEAAIDEVMAVLDSSQSVSQGMEQVGGIVEGGVGLAASSQQRPDALDQIEIRQLSSCKKISGAKGLAPCYWTTACKHTTPQGPGTSPASSSPRTIGPVLLQPRLHGTQARRGRAARPRLRGATSASAPDWASNCSHAGPARPPPAGGYRDPAESPWSRPTPSPPWEYRRTEDQFSDTLIRLNR
jgi:hypothetical protein